jgi:hypothetical protein
VNGVYLTMGQSAYAERIAQSALSVLSSRLNPEQKLSLVTRAKDMLPRCKKPVSYFEMS